AEIAMPPTAVVTVKDLVVTQEYNTLGQVKCQTGPYAVDEYDGYPNESPYNADACTSHPHITSTSDALARPLTVTAPDGTNIGYEYGVYNHITVDGDNELSMARVVDARGFKTAQFYNAFGNLVMVREYGSNADQFGYADTRYSYDVL